MNILMLSDTETQGGAAIAASRLAEALCRLGHDVTRAVAVPDSEPHPWSTYVFGGNSLAMRALRRFRSLISEYPLRVVACRQLSRWVRALRPDVINVHNLHGAFRVGAFPALLRVCVENAPTVWTLHDMWSFTGRCAYAYDCRKFLIGCDRTCLTPAEYPQLSPYLIARAWRRRRRLLARYPQIIAVSPSRWLAQEARAGLWHNHRVETVPNGLPLDVYRPLDRVLARQALGLKYPGPVALVAAQNLGVRYKGGALLQGALSRPPHRPLTVITLGRGTLELEEPWITVHRLGYVDHERTKVLAYNAADIFVHPARADNLPNVVMEAIACGVPVVGFRVGGVPDMVRPGQTGWLAEEIGAEALSAQMDLALEALARGTRLRDSCRRIAETEYDVDVQAMRYVALFRDLCGVD